MRYLDPSVECPDSVVESMPDLSNDQHVYGEPATVLNYGAPTDSVSQT